MKKNALKPLIWLLVIAIFTTQCQMYHLKEVETESFSRFPNYKSRLSYHLIVHQADGSIIEVLNPRIGSTTLTGNVGMVSEQITSIYNLALSKRNFRGKVRQNKMYLNQLHLFVGAAVFKDGSVQLLFEDIQKVQVLEKNKGLTTLSVIGIGAPSFVASFMIYLFIACNCPHAYVYNGHQWEFTNSLYTGAVHPELERYDFKNLTDFSPNSSAYSLQIRNELDEIQYTNELKLLAVYHAKGTTVVSDQNGHIYGFRQRILPTKIVNDEGTTLAAQVAEADDQSYAFETIDKSHFSHVYASFHNEKWTDQPVLVLRAKNTNWAGYLYHEFTSLFGEKYANWVEGNSDKTQAELNANIAKTGMLMRIEIKDGKEWKEIDQIQLVGERAYNNIAVPIPQKYLQHPDLEFRLRSGFQFWQIDELYMAQGSQQGLEMKVYDARVSDQQVQTALAQNDAAYFVHKQGEAPLELSFNGLKAENRALFLKSKGYYRSYSNHEGKPNYAALWQIRKDGGLSLFSKSKYEELLLIQSYFAEIPRD